MSTNQARFPVATMARVLGVSKAGFYAWLHRAPSAHAVADAALLQRVRTVHASSRQTYGAPRVHAKLRAHGAARSRKRIARLMRDAGLVGASHRRGGPTTTRRDKEARPAPDLVDRNFTAMAESFFSTLEAELLSRRRFASQVEARMACFGYIEGWYNPVRLHSALGYRSPMAYEADTQSATNDV